jgi:hypothetical protein
MPKSRSKTRKIVDYIIRQRANGWRDGQIREHMEMTKGYTPSMLNNYFRIADKEDTKKHVIKFAAPAMIILLLIVGGMYTGAGDNLTGAASWWSTRWGASTYSCGDDVPTSDIMDMTDCIDDDEADKSNIFCYYDKDTSVDDLQNEDWYSDTFGIELSDYTTITTLELLGKVAVLPWDATGDDVDCFTWDYGVTAESDWHACTDDDSDGEPDNLVFYYNDMTFDDDVGVGHLSTTLSESGSYYLCYDELECTTSSTSCDESNDEYCVGMLSSATGSAWMPCDGTATSTTQYRCCTGGCNGQSMVCADDIESQDGATTTEFTECVEDGTSACCTSEDACVYNGECYDEDETTTMSYGSLGTDDGGDGYTESTYGEIFVVCSDDNTWCPEGTSYDARGGVCEALEAACYDSTDTDYCEYILSVDDIEDWESDTDGTDPCVDELSTATASATHKGCIWQEVSGMDYYFYQDIEWY